MSTPSKRRRKNDGTVEPVRGLDYFFAKQQQKKSELKSQPTAAAPEAKSTLTDEELARKLQAEWDEEDRLNRIGAAPAKDGAQKNAHPAELESTKSPISLIQQTTAPSPAKVLALQSSATDEDELTSNIPFDESPLTFDPQKYVPALQEHWSSDNGHATYALLTRCFVLVNATTSRIKIVDTLVNLLRIIIESDPGSMLPAVWLATNSISPPYIDMELGLGGSAISKALKKCCGLDNAGLKSLYSKYGDAGDVAFEAKKRQSFTLKKPKPLTIKSVFDSLVKIATSKGQGSQENKQRIVERLILDSRGAEESRYIVRTLVQHLRIGAVKTTMLIALSRAFLMSKAPGHTYDIESPSNIAAMTKEARTALYSKAEEIVKACFARHPNYADLIPALTSVGVCDELLVHCGLTLHIPLRPMLGSITRDLSDMLTRLSGRAFACEYKYDGQRCQVHCDAKGKVSLFSRHLELMTDKYPDLVALVPSMRGTSVESFILEGEIVAVDKDGGLQPFQTLSNRARKDVQTEDISIHVCLFAFDLMYLNGQELMDRPFRERRSLLHSLFSPIPQRFTWVQSLDATSSMSDEILPFFQASLTAKCEGIMVKLLDNDIPSPDEAVKASRRKHLLATYTPDKRLEAWLKVKKDYTASHETLDLIPIAGWHGQGRKAAWWSPILLACRRPDTGELVAVTKCMSGFSDAFYKANRAKYNPDSEGGDTRPEKPGWVDYTGHPDVWFEAGEVWEVAFADVTMSPTYNAALGLVSSERGLSLRFPRFLKVREDKGVDEASMEADLAELWWKQEERGEKEDAKEPEDEGDDY